MGIGLKDLKSHLLDSLPAQLAGDTFAAFMEAQSKGKSKDWSEETKPGNGLEIDDDGTITFNGVPVPKDTLNTELDKAPKGDARVEVKKRKMSREEGKEEAGRIFENRHAADIEITKEMIEDMFGEENGEIVWNQIVATSILERIIIPNEPKGKLGKLAEKQRMGVGRGTELYKKKHRVAQSIQQAGDYYPGTTLGYSRSKPETYLVREKDKGGANFSICIDVSGSNGSRSDPNSTLNAVCCIAAAIVAEGKALDMGISLYINPTGSPIPADHELINPIKEYPVETLIDWGDPSKGSQIEMVGPDIDPRYYFNNSKNYEALIRVLTEEIESVGCEYPAGVFGRLVYDLNNMPKKDKKTILWIADCTIPELYLGIKNFYDIIDESDNEFWIIHVGGSKDLTIQRDMASYFGDAKGQGGTWKNVKYVNCPDFHTPGVNPDTIAPMLAQVLGLEKVGISGNNGLRDLC